MNERNTLSMPNIQPAAQDTPLIMPVAKETSAISFEGGNVSLTSYALPQKTSAHLTAALRAAPHLAACANYADTAPEKPLRLIFCAEHLPTAIQAAACLSACHGADEERSGQKDDVWDDLDAYLDLGENENAKDLPTCSFSRTPRCSIPPVPMPNHRCIYSCSCKNRLCCEMYGSKQTRCFSIPMMICLRRRCWIFLP